MVVNGVDTQRIDQAARALRHRPDPTVRLELPAAVVADWLSVAALNAEHSRLGQYVGDLYVASQIADAVLSLNI